MHADPLVFHLYLPWLAAAMAATLELEGLHRLRRAMWGVHPIPLGFGWLVLCGAGMGGAWALAAVLIYIAHALQAQPVGYWLPWVVCLIYLAITAERERRAARVARATVDREAD